MSTLAVIPARSGSKGIPHKNIRPFCGKPLIAHSIDQARAAKLVTRVIVSTDSEEYAAVARQYGADVPFLRPPELSGDHSTDLEAFEHALDWLDKHEGYRPDLCLHLRPTYPTRRVEDVDRAVRLLLDHPEFDSVRSVVAAPETPFKMWFHDPDGSLRPVVTHPDFPEAYNRPRQELPKTYLQNAAIDVVRAWVIRDLHSMTGRRILGMPMADFHDIDDLKQFAEAEAVAKAALPPPAAPPGATQPMVGGPLTIAPQEGSAPGHPAPVTPDVTGKTFVFDIDGVIATLTPGNDYTLAGPIESHVRIVNRLYDQGNKIILFTARGTMTGIDWTDLTTDQMRRWGVKYHTLKLGKPAGDVYVDDRMLSLTDLAKLFG